MSRETPAIAGGEKIKKTPYGREKRYGEAELEELREALEQGTLFYAQGKKVKAREAEFAEANGVGYAVACTSGTAAVHAALMAAGVSPGDEVITSPITDMGSVAPILFQGAVPIFADLHPHAYTLSPESVASKITPRTRAVLAVHLTGNACDLGALKAICEPRNIALIEDCAQAFGCRYQGKPIGTLGVMGCFSFNEFKHISCGDGGIVVTSDAGLAERLRLATDKAYNRRSDALERRPTFLANNYRMTELQAAVARAQFRKLDLIVERRRRWCAALSEGISGISGLSLPQITEGCDPSWWFYLLRVDAEALGTDIDTFTRTLQAEGLPAGAHYIGQPLYEYPIFTQKSAFDHAAHACDAYVYASGDCPNAEAILNTCLMISVNEAYTQCDLEETIRAIRRAAAWYAPE